MKKYDCSKVLDYLHELKRLFDYNSSHGDPLSCNECPFDYLEECRTMAINQSMIDILQKWSDEHPEKTRAEAFLGIFPKYTKCFYYPCFNKLIGKGWEPYCNNNNCIDCWDEPYNGEFEEARKDES